MDWLSRHYGRILAVMFLVRGIVFIVFGGVIFYIEIAALPIAMGLWFNKSVARAAAIALCLTNIMPFNLIMGFGLVTVPYPYIAAVVINGMFLAGLLVGRRLAPFDSLAKAIGVLLIIAGMAPGLLFYASGRIMLHGEGLRGPKVSNFVASGKTPENWVPVEVGPLRFKLPPDYQVLKISANPPMRIMFCTGEMDIIFVDAPSTEISGSIKEASKEVGFLMTNEYGLARYLFTSTSYYASLKRGLLVESNDDIYHFKTGRAKGYIVSTEYYTQVFCFSPQGKGDFSFYLRPHFTWEDVSFLIGSMSFAEPNLMGWEERVAGYQADGDLAGAQYAHLTAWHANPNDPDITVSLVSLICQNRVPGEPENGRVFWTFASSTLSYLLQKNPSHQDALELKAQVEQWLEDWENGEGED